VQLLIEFCRGQTPESVTRAEFEFAVTHEGALDIEDILDRRTRIGLVAEDRAHAVDAAAEFLTATR
jgi:glycerol-3-phosphate dehydrogenase